MKKKQEEKVNSQPELSPAYFPASGDLGALRTEAFWLRVGFAPSASRLTLNYSAGFLGSLAWGS